MQIDMPEVLTPDNQHRLLLRGKVMKLGRDVDVYYYRWTLGQDTTDVTLDFVARVVFIPDEAAQAQKDMLVAALAAFMQPPAWHAVARQILQLAQSAVGVDVRQLTDNQRWALLAVLMWDRKAIGNDLTIRPLGEWVTRQPRD